MRDPKSCIDWKHETLGTIMIGNNSEKNLRKR